MAGPEAKMKRRITSVLKYHDIWYFFPASNGFGRAGIPDIIAIVDGQFVGIEAKADRNKRPTALQTLCGEQIRSAGGEWFLVRCQEDIKTLDDFLSNAETFGYLPRKGL